MKSFEYVDQNEWAPAREDLFKLIHLVQKEVSEYFTFRFDLIGSASRRMITREVNGNIGYDFDVNIRVNDPNENFTAEQIRKILRYGFDKHSRYFSYDFSEDSTRVICIKVKDKKHSKILYSCDFAVVFDCSDGRQQYIRFDKKQGSYYWEYQPKGFYKIDEKIADIKKANLWQEVRELYLRKKCNNNDANKKSRSIFAETINEIHNYYFC